MENEGLGRVIRRGRGVSKPRGRGGGGNCCGQSISQNREEVVARNGVGVEQARSKSGGDEKEERRIKQKAGRRIEAGEGRRGKSVSQGGEEA